MPAVPFLTSEKRSDAIHNVRNGSLTSRALV
jgi:hypothetical protein